MRKRRRLRPHEPPDCDRLLVIVSDIEMGTGGPTDDFPHSDFLAELILSYNQSPFKQLAVDVVFNGDTFDLLKTSHEGAFPRHITAAVALGKFRRVAAAHPAFFRAVRQFLAHKSAPRRVALLVGNHDPEIQFTEVKQAIRELCDVDGRLSFPGTALDIGKVHIEHGHQLDPSFRVDPEVRFVRFDDQEVLNISWASAALLDTVMPLQPLLHFYDRLKPKSEVFELLPELKELLLDAFWQYWTHDYWEGYFDSDDPTRRLTWTMLKETIWRFGSRNPEVSMDDTFVQRLRDDDRYALCVLGHQHQAMCWSYGDRKVLQSGGFRNEYMLGNRGQQLRPIPKSYVEVYLSGGMPVQSGLLELPAPPTPPGYVPESIFDVLPTVRSLLASNADRAKNKAGQHAQEQRESGRPGPGKG
jgi:UDP-2,3-diacylglucosamine pyrophosphatase LpxH